jgi:hypothetical protein
VLHGVLENFGFISFKDAAVLILYYLALTLLIAGIFWLLLRNKQHAAIITTAFMAFFFFYSPFMDFIKEKYPDSFFNKYTFLLSVIVITMVVIFIYLKRSNKVFPQLSLFLNELFITYILIDIGWLMVKVVNPPLNPLSIYSFAKEKDTLTCKSCAKPNVYFLLFDEYASSLSLKEQFNFDNSPLDNFLLKEGFHINRQSNSNYNYTPFSMASVLNMSYIEGLKDPSHLVAQDFTNVNQLIRNNKVIKIFSSLGYQLKIYSIFDIAGYPAKAWQSFLPLKTRLITERTLAARLRKSTESLLIRRFNIKYFVVQNYMNYLFSNEKFLKLAAEEADQKNSSPKFVYAHFIMPHFPYIFDSLGHRKNDRQIYEDIQNNPPPAYLNYLQYTNRRIEELVEHIRQKDPNAVILLCGDHGYRYPTNKPRPFSHLQNLNAVYFPDQDYSKWGDKISFVNQFRIVFNKLFQFNYPLLKDSTIFLFEKQAGD